MRTDWDDVVKVIPGAVSLATCDRIVAEGSLLELNPGKITEAKTGDQRVDPLIRAVAVGWFDLGWVHDLMQKLALEANGSWKYHLTEMDPVQFAIYREHDFFEWHSDFRLVRKGAIRKFTLVVQLSEPEDYVGGDLQFIDGGVYTLEAFRKRGTAVAFASMMTHRVTPVKKGVRKSLTSWFKGPPFR